MIYDIIVIGAGASGLFCASQFPKHINGIILEHTKSAGKKLLMSGKGQCNITNDEDIKNFPFHYGQNGNKIRSILYKYNQKHLYNFFNKHQVPLFIRDDKKVFPQSLKAATIQKCLIKHSFPIEYDTCINHIYKENGIFKIITNKKTYEANHLVLSIGGLSYPNSGSDGSLYPLLKKDLSITFTKLKPALAPIYLKEYPFSHLSGLSLKNISLSLYDQDKKIYQAWGDLLFTHKQLSGPLIINNSRYIEKGMTIKFNYIQETYEEALLKLKNALSNNQSHIAKHIIKLWCLPERFVYTLFPKTIKDYKLKDVVHKLVEDTYIVEDLGSFHHAMVTHGGIDLNQINLKTMEFKSIPHLYAIGECLDIDGDTGGYNLQFAYSSACLCACSIQDSLN